MRWAWASYSAAVLPVIGTMVFGAPWPICTPLTAMVRTAGRVDALFMSAALAAVAAPDSAARLPSVTFSKTFLASSWAGSVAAAFGLGIFNKILEPQMGAVLGKILILVLIILFIQKRPRGLFAQKGRAVEA